MRGLYRSLVVAAVPIIAVYLAAPAEASGSLEPPAVPADAVVDVEITPNDGAFANQPFKCGDATGGRFQYLSLQARQINTPFFRDADYTTGDGRPLRYWNPIEIITPTSDGFFGYYTGAFVDVQIKDNADATGHQSLTLTCASTPQYANQGW